jgi:hypothetical protein
MARKRVKKWLKIILWAIGSIIVVIAGGMGYLYLKYAPKPNVYVPLETRWTAEVSPENVHSEYPRPQMVRPGWQNLNGLWQYAISPVEKGEPDVFDGEILVPFAVESSLSGVQKRVGDDNYLWYRKTFEADAEINGRLLLHFGAVDWHSVLWVNGKEVGEHKGGHVPFSFDITDYLNSSGEQELLLRVWDPTDEGPQPRGKQVNKPRLIYYTPVTGIWQTVWLEPVPLTSIEKLNIVPDIDEETITVAAETAGIQDGDQIRIVAFTGGDVIAETSGNPNGNITMAIPEPHLWSPESPFLYDLEIQILRDGETIDKVSSYFGMRKISTGEDSEGIIRIMLNNQPIFNLGLLDQGWWPDGLYTAPTDEALRYDIEKTMEMGFNMIRKHVKIEPARWYYHCDKLGVLVWQDMPSGEKSALPNKALVTGMLSGDGEFGEKYPDIQRSPESAEYYLNELTAMIDAFQVFPSIIVWVPFNESWGQFKTNEVIDKVRQMDPSRIIDGTSGWIDRGGGDMRDYHIYNRGLSIQGPEPERTIVIGEFGGLGHSVEGHLGVEDSWSYTGHETREDLAVAYENLFRAQLIPLIDKGLSGAVYTQTTDVESEINGLMTYDRAVDKIDPSRLHSLHNEVYTKLNATVGK